MIDIQTNVKKRIFWLFIIAETGIFSFYYIAGANGLKAIRQLKNENDTLVEKISGLRHTINTLNEGISAMHTYPWCKEKIAREDLQMAYPDEEIFLL